MLFFLWQWIVTLSHAASVPMLLLRDALQIEHWTSDNECGWSGVTCDFTGSVQGITLIDEVLSDPLPAGIFSSLPQLQWVIIVFSSWNENYTSTIPEDICTGNQVTELGFEHFKIGTNLPAAVFECSKLTALHFVDTGLTGPIPDLFTQLPKLERVELDKNELTGEIPESLASLPGLKVVELQGNKLTGPLLAFVSEKLEVLDVRNNGLTGSVDVTSTQASFKHKPHLVYLGAEFNKLTLPQQCQGAHYCYITVAT